MSDVIDTSSGSKIRAFVVLVLIGLLVIAFAVWGVSDVFSPQSRNVVMKVGEAEITSAEFDRIYRQELDFENQKHGTYPTSDEAYAKGIHSRVLNDLYNYKLLEVDANDLGVGSNAESLRDLLDDYTVFQDPLTGEFSLDLLDSYLGRNDVRMTRKMYEKQLIAQIMNEQTRPVIIEGIYAPDQFGKIRDRYDNEALNISLLTLTSDSVPSAPEPSDEELKAYIEQNKNNFPGLIMHPEYRKFSMIRLEPYDFILMDENTMYGVDDREKLKDSYFNIFVDEERIREQYDIRVSNGQLGTQARRSLIQLTALNEQNANEIIAKLKSGLTPDEVTGFYGLTVEPITYDNVLEADIFDPEVAKNAFEMATGETRAFYGGFDNWVVVQVVGGEEAVLPDYETEKLAIAEEYRVAYAKEQIQNQIQLVEDEVRNGRTLEEAAELVGVPMTSIDFIDRSGRTKDNLLLSGIQRTPPLVGTAGDENLLVGVFTGDLGFETDYIDTSTGGMAIVRVDEIEETKERAFEDIKDQVTQIWKSEHVDDAIAELTLELTQRVRDGETLKEVADSLSGGAYYNEISINRGLEYRNIGQMVQADIKTASVGDIEYGYGPAPLQRQIAVLNSVSSYEASTDQVMNDRMSEELRNDLIIAYLNATAAEHDRQDFPDTVKTVMGVSVDTE